MTSKLLSSRLVRRAAAAAMIAGVIAAAGVAFAKRPVDVRSMPVDTGAVERLAIGTGTLESEMQVTLAFTIPGRISEILVREGESVRAGDVVAKLDASEHERQLALAARGTEIAAAGATRSDAEIARAEIALVAARRDESRISKLVESGTVPQAELDVGRERVDRAKAELDAARASRQQGTGNIAAARATVDVQAQRRDEGLLRSPLDGIVVRRVREPGDVVGPAAQVLVVASTRKIWARVWIDESALRDVREGQVARVTLRSDPAHVLRARLDRVAVEADRQTHEVLADRELVERPGRLVLGERVDGAIVVERRDSALRVGQGVCDVAGARCLVDRGGRVAAANVRFGLVGSEWVEVLDGLAADDVLLASPDGKRELPLGRRHRGASR
jgi:RND family efflux transporter MFP subunit